MTFGYSATAKVNGVDVPVLGWVIDEKPKTDSERLFDSLCENVEDFDLMRIYADSLEDEGKTEEAECFRWLARWRRRPYFYEWWNKKDWQWCYSQDSRNTLSSLPMEFFPPVNKYPINFDDVKSAYQFVVAKWKDLRSKGWEPEDLY